MILPRVFACLVLAGCAALPASGPTERDVLDAESSAANTLGFRIVDLSPSVIDALRGADDAGIASMEAVGGPARVDAIGPGDTLAIAIFEVGAGLFSGGGGSQAASGEAATNAGNVRLPPVQVDASGMIEVPYAGRVRAAGRTPIELAETIRADLKTLSQDPQVVVSVTEGVSTAVYVQGDVRSPGRRMLTLGRERLLDLVALAGGAAHSSSDTTIELTRGGRSASAPLVRVEDEPAENVMLRPGDRVRLVHRPRTFTAFGASGKVAEIPFDTAEVSLAEGIARAGGPQNDRADPNAVFLFRFEQPSVAERVVGPAATPAPGPRPVIYRVDLMQPQNYFLSQRFALRDKDLIYVANARTDRFSKFVNIVYSLAFPALTGAQLTR
jgi:polysaccharide export outer membrane protein